MQYDKIKKFSYETIKTLVYDNAQFKTFEEIESELLKSWQNLPVFKRRK